MELSTGINEEQLKRWAAAPSETEETKCQNAVRQITEAIKERYGSEVTVFLQGSYKNRTNVRNDSDVDVVVRHDTIFFPDLSNLSENDKAVYNSTRVSSDYTFQQFKNDVQLVLEKKFEKYAIERKDKCIKVKANSYRVNADVVPCYKYKKFKTPYDVSVEGIQLFTDQGIKIISFPDQHFDNGQSKNVRTSRTYKSIVRILKNLKNELVDQGAINDELISSFFLECLTWNVPDSEFATNTFYQATRNIVAKVYNDMKSENIYSKYTEVSGLKWLCAGAPNRTPAQAQQFMQSAYNFIGYK